MPSTSFFLASKSSLLAVWFVSSHLTASSTIFVLIQVYEADIDRMVREAEENKAQDGERKQRVDAKNGLENYVYSIRNTINDPKLEGKIPDEDKLL